MDDSNEFPVVICFEAPLDGSLLSDVEELSELINSSPTVEVRGVNDGRPEGAKPELATILAVVSSATGVAGLVLQAIQMWKQGKPKYSISVTEDGQTYSVDNLSSEEYLQIVQRLNNRTPIRPMFVKLNKRIED